jgi:hypothetical protein
MTGALLSLAIALAGCATSTADNDLADQDTAAASQAANVTTINGAELLYEFLPLGLEEPALAFAGVRAGASRDQVRIQTSLFALAPAAHTLTVHGASGAPATVPMDVPQNVVSGAVGRLAVFVANATGGYDPVLADTGLNLFERVSVSGDAMTYETVTSSGQRVSGRIELPGLQSGSTRYAFAAIPRNVSRGSIFGTHFFRVDVACVQAGCASRPQL